MRSDEATAQRFREIAASSTTSVSIRIDGVPIATRGGRTVLAALLLNSGSLRDSAAAGEPRAGFCLMGACQDCWVWLESGARIRACTTPVAEGMAIRRSPPDNWPLHGNADRKPDD